MRSPEIKTLQFSEINKRLFVAIVILAVAFFGAQILVTSQVGTKSAEIDQIRAEKDTLRLENEILRSKINEVRSISFIEDLAENDAYNEKYIITLDAPITDDIALQ